MFGSMWGIEIRAPQTSKFQRNKRAVLRLLAMTFVVFCSIFSAAQTADVFPEIDTYLKLNSKSQIWIQAKTTREDGVPTQAEIGPSLVYFAKPLTSLARLVTFDLNDSNSHLLVLSLGYRYLPQAGGAPSTNRIEPVATIQIPFKAGLQLSDRNRADLDWENGGFTWRYRHRFQVQRAFTIRRFHVSPYASAEFFYSSAYQKWSTTALYSGFCVPLRNRLEIIPYYEHENNTGPSPNQQVNAFGLIVNLYFSLHS